MSELKWEKTTFGELKRLDIYDSVQYNKEHPTVDDSGESLFYVFGGEEQPSWDWPMWGDISEAKDVPVWRAVSPEREALEKIRDAFEQDYGGYKDMAEEMRAIATAALEDAQKGGGE